MSEFNNRNKYHFWHSPLVLVVMFCLIILFIYNIISLIEKERETAKKKTISQEQVDNLKYRELSISKEINKLKTEDGIEESIREKYQVVKPGEKIVVIVNEEEDSEADSVETKKGFIFIDWLKSLFNK